MAGSALSGLLKFIHLINRIGFVNKNFSFYAQLKTERALTRKNK